MSYAVASLASALFVALSAIVLGCSSPSKEKAPEKLGEKKSVPQASIEAKQLAAENEATVVTEVRFAKGKNDLSAEAKQRLGELIKSGKTKGKPERLMVIAWADQEYPSVNSGTLPEREKKLADQRGKTISDYLKNLGQDLEIKNYNMAERPNSVERLLRTSEARIKRSLEVAGIPNTDTSVKTPSKASRAIVLLVLRE